MWNSSFPEDSDRGRQPQQNLWHRDDGPSPPPRDGSDDGAAPESGTWGEHDTGLTNHHTAEDFNVLRRELSQTQTSLHRAATGRSFRQTDSKPLAPPTRVATHATTATATTDGQPHADDGEKDEEDDDFELGDFMRQGHFEKRNAAGDSAKKIGLIYRNLTVRGAGSSTTYGKTLPDAVLGTFGPDLWHLLTRAMPFLKFGRKQPTRVLLDDFSGHIRNGEMTLVLGRPGSGCSTFLKVITNNRQEYAAVEGHVSYGGISAEDQKKKFRGEVVYNAEDDRHFPNLTVLQTLQLALSTKTRKRNRDNIPTVIDALLKVFGISHTKHTPVGDGFIRGVSGGERKRVSIVETLAAKSTIISWDNSTRGLDSSTALDYAKSLRIMTDISDRTTIVTLYQAGESIYELFDKVIVIDAGKCLYQGPANMARQYFESLGFSAPERQTTPDFLTSIADPTARSFQPGKEASTPKTPDEIAKAFRTSDIYKQEMHALETYEQTLKDTDYADAKEFVESSRQQKSNKTVPKNSSYTVSFPHQVLICAKRELWLVLMDRTTLWTKLFTIIANGLIIASLFYGQSLNTSGAFLRGGSVFLGILLIGWLQLSELIKAVAGRDVIVRHRNYAMYKPSAVALGRVLADIPVILPQVSIFVIILYFMTGLDLDAAKFWIYFLLVFTVSICITALYRMFAALSPSIDDAVRFSGIALNLLIIYTGYVISKPLLLSKYIWFGWLYHINPIAYAFEAVLVNEFGGRVMECDPSQLVPSGPEYSAPNQGCALPGAQKGETFVTGDSYLAVAFDYSRSNLWRNFGIIIALTIFYLAVTMFGTEVFDFSKGDGGALVFKKPTWFTKRTKANLADEEKVKAADAVGGSGVSSLTSNGLHSDGKTLAKSKTQDEALQDIPTSDQVFTWKDIEYTVPYMGGERKLLNKVSGYVKPGQMIALMGASGAGKTTLLNTLAQRQRTGVVSGDMLVDGKPLDVDFARRTGFCEQADLHDGSQTIREALEFSALLRQDSSVPKQEKLAYVNNILNLLELEDIQDAIVSSLDVERRKRLTIGVELAAKPSLNLFLDEPTSGLDANSAYSIVRFLKKLSQSGQAIVCTIHQPSSLLMQQFDYILALNPGGNTFYFGPVGENGQDVISYFASKGIECPPNKNVAEFILETAAKPVKGKDGKRINWNNEWLERNKDVQKKIEAIHNDRRGAAAAAAAAANSKDAGKSVAAQQFAASTWDQSVLLTKRVFRQHWRDPSYYYGKLFVSVIIGIFNGFTFWQLGNTVQDMQNRMFTLFVVTALPPTIVNSVLPKFFQNMSLWMAREHPSRTYGWVAFTTAQVVTEIPMAIVCSLIYWVTWYFPTGLPTDPSTAGYVFLMSMLFFLFVSSWGQWICAFAPSFTVIANVLPLFFVMTSLFNGVVRPYSTLPVFWKYWMYYASPLTYWIGGVIAACLPAARVECADSETAYFDPPSGQSCQEYAAAFLARSLGYLVDPNATSDCQYCPYKDGTEFMATLNVLPEHKWRNFGIFLGFCISNWALVYFFIWSVRVKGWSFGFGYVFGKLEKAVGVIKRPFQKKKMKGEEGEAAKAE